MSARAFRAAVMTLGVGLSACAADIHPTVSPASAVSRMEELWERPAAIATADLLNGPWGVDHAPDAGDTYTFLRKKRRGASSILCSRRATLSPALPLRPRSSARASGKANSCIPAGMAAS